jgi:hypothetical protein
MATQQEIAQNYQQLFGRTFDPEGAAYWASTGLSGNALTQAMIGGAQSADQSYYQSHQPTNSVFTGLANDLPTGNETTYPVTGPAPIRSGLMGLSQATPSTTGLGTWTGDSDMPAPYTNTPTGAMLPSSTSQFGITNPSALTTQFGSSTDPYVKAAQATSLANMQGAQAATAANRVNQMTPYGGLQYQQTGVDAQGNPIWSATQTLAPQFQTAFGNIAKQVEQTTGQGFNPNLPSYGINPGETYSDAIMRRLQPQQERQSKSLDVQLANQGIMPGSEAYNTAKTQLAQAQNDQLTSAIVGGMQTGLTANQQAYNQALTNYQLPLATLSQFKSATTPSYVNPYTQAAVAGPDYLGAYTTGQNAQLAANAAQQAGQAGITSGLFNLAGTAIANPSAISSAYNWAKNAYNTGSLF